MALAALCGDKTIQEIAAKRQLHPTQVTTWKRQAQEGLAGVFSDKAKKSESKDREITYIPSSMGFVSDGNHGLGDAQGAVLAAIKHAGCMIVDRSLLFPAP